MPTNFDSMKALYCEQIADLLNAEKQLVRALPKAIKAASSDELREALSSHLDETNGHVQRLEKIVSGLDTKPPAQKCAAMQGLIAEASEIIEAKGHADVKDAALVAAAQRVEHYEMAGYGCARTFALKMGRKADAKLLQATLDEERNANQRLTDIAESSINERAAQA